MTAINSNMEKMQEFGQPVPEFALPLLDGTGKETLHDLLIGKRGAVIVFWSAVCTHCWRYDNYFNAFAEWHPELGFAVIASRYGEKPEEIQDAARQRYLHFPILLDEGGEIAGKWRSQQTPRCYLITADGRLLYRGAIDNFKFPTDPEYVAYLEPTIASYLSDGVIIRSETASFGCAIETTYYHLPRQL
ncbi:MAG: redoxin domain-containing protein [Acidobacteriia bacterium]|nr:redoxin domain-containing protein [Terriglobia bacterium]